MQLLKLNEKGQCPKCLKKPIPYKGVHAERQKFCARCDRSYDFDTGVQRANWAYNAEGVRVRGGR